MPNIFRLETDREPVSITAALIAAGASLLTSSGNHGSGHWQLKDGTKINADRCWQDGSGACPNGESSISSIRLKKSSSFVALQETVWITTAAGEYPSRKQLCPASGTAFTGHTAKPKSVAKKNELKMKMD